MAKIQMPSDEKAKFLLEIVEDRKAIEPKLLDLRGKTLLADFFLICAGFNNIHIKAISDRVLEESDDRNLATPRVEGAQISEWVLMDFGDVIVHIMTEEARDRYKLEEYWTNPQPKGALPPTPSSLRSLNDMESVSVPDEEDMDDLDEEMDDDEEDDDAAFFDEADTEVEPIDEDDEDFDEVGDVKASDREDYIEGSEESDELDDYDEDESDVDTLPTAPEKDEGATYAAFDAQKPVAASDATDELFVALNNNAQPGRSDAELDDDDLPDGYRNRDNILGEDIVADGDLRDADKPNPLKFNPEAAALSDSTPPANTPEMATPTGTADGVGEASTR